MGVVRIYFLEIPFTTFFNIVLAYKVDNYLQENLEQLFSASDINNNDKLDLTQVSFPPYKLFTFKVWKICYFSRSGFFHRGACTGNIQRESKNQRKARRYPKIYAVLTFSSCENDMQRGLLLDAGRIPEYLDE